MPTNVVDAPPMTLSHVKAKKSTTNLFMLYTAHILKYIKNAVDVRDKTKEVFPICIMKLQR